MKKIKYLLLSLCVLLADQLSKWYVTEQIIRPATIPNDPAATSLAPMGFFDWFQYTPPRLPFYSIEICPIFNFVMVWNEGISFGLFSDDSNFSRYILIALSAAACLWFVIWLFYTQSKMQSLSIALVIGGAIGNMLDRARFGAVVDFLDFHIGGWHYPAFNIADSAIVIGVFVLLYNALFRDGGQV